MINDLQELLEKLKLLDETLYELSLECVKALNDDRKIIFAGNGGSAADSQHLAAELVGRFTVNRKALKAISLTTDTSNLTSIANDFGFEHVFSRQLDAIGNKGDILIILSTSGNSKNLIELSKVAKNKDIFVGAFLGKMGGSLKDIADKSLIVRSFDTARIQECHILMGHTLCSMIESSLGLA